ncbi:putative disease resistance protein RGA4 isoform X1 [Trifolium pratense]|uniref:putative disease resistance protein RGA4 isoform X1 n=1 Tax=Trifolium pratense TaxID=57577 RepID=UPI001E695D1F|nr:putative disease resistance protein RGA4 isoform X1 [Trifolium pratense]
MADLIVSTVNRSIIGSFRIIGRIYGVDLEKFKNDVESIKAMLHDAEDNQEKDEHIRNWIRAVKDHVLHPADNLLDEFLIEDMRYKMETHKSNAIQVYHSSFRNQIVFRSKMVSKIGRIQKKINELRIFPMVYRVRARNHAVVEQMKHPDLAKKDVVVEQNISETREACSFVFKSLDTIGREDDKKKIISLLKQPHGDQHDSVIAIVGIGGIGKTTLAQLVYNDGEVTKFFEKNMWVCVSDNFNVKTIVKKMLESLINSKIDDKLSADNLHNMLRDNLTGKRYLLVLDDVSNESFEKWAQLRTYLMCGAKDSKIVVTTRSINVATTMGVSVPYILKGLTIDESWNLLKNIITNGDETEGVNQTLELIGKKIAEMCKGVPLAIRTTGVLLQGKNEEKEWFLILHDDMLNIHEDNIMSVLKLSYKNLSPQLKLCFAYCSLYPKGWQIEKDELIQLWMAQGYLEFSGEHDSMEDIGNQFVMTFLKKLFFEDAKMDDDGHVYSFKMHDLMHDLAMYAADGDCCYLDSETKGLVRSPVHVSLKPKAVHLLDSLDRSRLRTLILLSSDEEEELKRDELFVISNFKYLRVLKLSYSCLSMLSESIGKLKHLRYLNLSRCTGLGSLFKSISIIVLLQTLILMPDEKVEFSTMAISKLINLRHLQISDWEASKVKNPDGFEKLSMQLYKGLISLPRLYKGMNFSNWLFPLSNIVEISLFLCGSFRYLPPLESHRFLKSLHISHLEELEYIYYEEALPVTFFPSLESLTIWFCGKLKGWWRVLDDFNHPNSSRHISLPPFPRLSQLSIIGCQMLTQMPTFPNLESRLELFDSSGETLEATLNMVASECPNDSPPLSMLKSLHIDGMGLDLEKVPKDWIQNLTSLQHLQINWFSCEIFQEISVWFKDNHNCLPSLQKLAFHNCEDLEALPDWICNLSSLMHLSMYDCINLASLPEGMLCLSNLQTLEIIGCPILIEECETQTSKVSTRIAHIPKIILK